MKSKIMLGMLSAVLLILLAAAPASAAVRGCSFKKTLKYKGSFFDVTSRPSDVCSIQVIEVVVRRGGKTFATFKTDADFLAETAWTADLNGDGKPELVVASKSAKDNGRGSLDVFWLNGNVIKRAEMSKNEEGAGYQGHDTFRLDGSRILRSFPVYRAGDPDNLPSGGTRILQYLFQDGRLELTGNKDEYASTAAVVAPEPRPDIEKQNPATVVRSRILSESTAKVQAGKHVIQGIVCNPCGIEIQTRSPIEKFRLHKLDKPARLAIDIPRAISTMTEQSIDIDNNVIARARIGHHSGFLRIVLDTNRPEFPKYNVIITDNGLQVAFAPSVNGNTPMWDKFRQNLKKRDVK